MDWKPLPRITQLLQHLRETQRAELACARRMVEVYNLGHKRLICDSLLQDTPVGIVIAERPQPMCRRRSRSQYLRRVVIRNSFNGRVQFVYETYICMPDIHPVEQTRSVNSTASPI